MDLAGSQGLLQGLGVHEGHHQDFALGVPRDGRHQAVLVESDLVDQRHFETS